MYTQNHTQLTELEKLEDKFDDIIADLNEKIVELEYIIDRKSSDISELVSDGACLENRVDELESRVDDLESQLDNIEES